MANDGDDVERQRKDLESLTDLELAEVRTDINLLPFNKQLAIAAEIARRLRPRIK